MENHKHQRAKEGKLKHNRNWLNLLCLCSCILLLYVVGKGLDHFTTRHVTEQEATHQPWLKANYRFFYGSSSLNFGDLRLPKGIKGPHPVAVLIHGGCWRTFADLHYLDRMAVALTKLGLATWNLEYRRLGNPEGGWPVTFLDIANGVDYLRKLAHAYDLDLSRIVVIGHSSGGSLAMWVAARRSIPASSPLYAGNPLPVSGVVDIDGPPDVEAYRQKSIRECGEDVIDRLVGGTPGAVPTHYAAVSTACLLPLAVPQRLLTGADDKTMPPRYDYSYAALARKAGDDIQVQVIPKAAHFDLIAPWSTVWPVVPQIVLNLL